MAKIKLSKTELKTQNDALKRYGRFLPTLELKKKQLISEIRKAERLIDEYNHAEKKMLENIGKWIKLFSEPVDWNDLIKVESIEITTENVAGVELPIFKNVIFQLPNIDPKNTDAWLDFARKVLCNLIIFSAKKYVINKQTELISRELSTTIQRINLFEKVKIPECKINIRKIQIFLGDQQSNSVVRGKISKAKTKKLEEQVAV